MISRSQLHLIPFLLAIATSALSPMAGSTSSVPSPTTASTAGLKIKDSGKNLP